MNFTLKLSEFHQRLIFREQYRRARFANDFCPDLGPPLLVTSTMNVPIALDLQIKQICGVKQRCIVLILYAAGLSTPCAPPAPRVRSSTTPRDEYSALTNKEWRGSRAGIVLYTLAKYETEPTKKAFHMVVPPRTKKSPYPNKKPHTLPTN